MLFVKTIRTTLFFKESSFNCLQIQISSFLLSKYFTALSIFLTLLDLNAFSILYIISILTVWHDYSIILCVIIKIKKQDEEIFY